VVVHVWPASSASPPSTKVGHWTLPLLSRSEGPEAPARRPVRLPRTASATGASAFEQRVAVRRVRARMRVDGGLRRSRTGAPGSHDWPGQNPRRSVGQEQRCDGRPELCGPP
jgi:hypothetical protein